jgi:PAS domain-containing protein
MFTAAMKKTASGTQFASEGIYELTGYHAEDFKRRFNVVGWLLHQDDQKQVSDIVKVAIKQKKPYQITYRIKTSDGKQKWVWEQAEEFIRKTDIWLQQKASLLPI